MACAPAMKLLRGRGTITTPVRFSLYLTPPQRSLGTLRSCERRRTLQFMNCKPNPWRGTVRRPQGEFFYRCGGAYVNHRWQQTQVQVRNAYRGGGVAPFTTGLPDTSSLSAPKTSPSFLTAIGSDLRVMLIVSRSIAELRVSSIRL